MLASRLLRPVLGLLTAASTAVGLGCNALLDISGHTGPLTSDGDAAVWSEAGYPPSYGALTTVARAASDAALTLPDGGRVTLTDDGFEPGGTLCSGTICVTGAITP